MLSIKDVNAMEYGAFMTNFGNIVQAAPWITASVWSLRPFTSSKGLHQCVCKLLDDLTLEGKADQEIAGY